MTHEPTGNEPETSVRLHDTSATERASFKSCHRSWFLQYGHRLGKAEGHLPFIFGTAMHEALATYYRAIQEDPVRIDPIAITLEVWADEWREQVDLLSKQLGGLAKFAAPEYEELGELGRAMLVNYMRAEADDPVVDEIVTVEERFEVPIRNGKGRILARLSVQLDLLGKLRGKFVVVDHKTAASAPNLNLLDMNDQMTAYIWATRLETGTDVRGAIYNALLKKATHPPVVLKNGKLSVNKQALVSYDDFRQAIVEHDLDINDYSEHLLHLQDNPPKLFVREETYRTKAQLLEFERNLVHEIVDMKRVAGRPQLAYPSPSAQQCGSCAVQLICRTLMERGDVGTIIRNNFTILPPRR